MWDPFTSIQHGPTFVVATSGGQETQHARELLCIDFDNIGELVDMDSLGVIHEDIGDLLSDSDTDASVVVYIREL